MEPLRGGNIINLPKQANDIIDEADVKRTPAEWALRWVWNHPEVSVVLSGMTTMDHVTENIEVAQKAQANSLTTKEVDMINAVKNLFKEKIKVNCTACAYCMPCPVGINIPVCFSTYNDYWIFDAIPAAKKMYQLWSNVAAPASNCAECGKCESHCPQGIAIRKELKNVRQLFE